MEALFLTLDEVSPMTEEEATQIYEAAEEAGVVAEPVDLGELVL